MRIWLFSAQTTTYSFLFDLTEKKIEYMYLLKRKEAYERDEEEKKEE